EKAKLHQRMILSRLKDPEHISKLPYKEKRKLIQNIFAGKDPSGKRLGIYIKRIGENWEFEINGRFLDKANKEVYTNTTELVSTFKLPVHQTQCIPA
ncbi:hypothetical protein ACFLZL_05310, partial [Thermodesulfobacteriota bacterium]